MATNAEYLAVVPFFSSLSNADREQLGELCVRQRLDAKAVLFKQGDAAHALYVVISGSVAVLQRAPGGQDEQIATRGAGDVIGEMALLEQSTRSATVVGLRACKLLSLSRESFESFLKLHPSAAISMVRVLSHRLRDLTAEVVAMRSRSLADRLYEYLQSLADGETVRVYDSQSSIASQLGCTREALNRNFRKLEQDGRISPTGRREWKLW